MSTRLPPRIRTILTALIVAPSLTACVGAGAVRSLPPATGLEASYAIPADRVTDALPEVLDEVGASVEEQAPLDADGRMVVGARPMTLFSWGDFSRVLVRPDGEGGTEVRVAARSRYALDWSGRAGRTPTRILHALDQRLGPEAVAVLPGMRIRGRSSERGLVAGSVVARDDGGWGLAIPGREGNVMAPTDIDEAEVFRGSYGHGAEGAAVGMLLGIVVGAAVDTGQCSGWCFGGLGGAYLGMAVGTLVGFGAGSMIRTEVWSPMATSAMLGAWNRRTTSGSDQAERRR